jgi:hypothetical protein
MFEVLTRGIQVFHKRELDITKGDQKPSRRGGPVGKRGINEATKKEEIVVEGAVAAVEGDMTITEVKVEGAVAAFNKRKADAFDEVEVEEKKTYISKHANGARGHTSFLLFAKFHCRD